MSGFLVSVSEYSLNAAGPRKKMRLPARCAIRKPTRASPVAATTCFFPIEEEKYRSRKLMRFSSRGPRDDGTKRAQDTTEGRRDATGDRVTARRVAGLDIMGLRTRGAAW